jgi:chromosome partitioning protein
MTLFLGFVSQKGGVGKSTLSKLIAREYAVHGWEVKIADMDVSQATTYNWNSRRLKNAIEPVIRVEQFRRVEDVLKIAASYDLIIFDGAPHATKETYQIAQACHLVVLPTGISLDDLEPTVKLAHELKKEGIAKEKIAFALCRVGNSESEIQEAKEYIRNAGYFILGGEIAEKTGYRRASDLGKTLVETTHGSLNRQAEIVAQSIIDQLNAIVKLEG